MYDLSENKVLYAKDPDVPIPWHPSQNYDCHHCDEVKNPMTNTV